MADFHFFSSKNLKFSICELFLEQRIINYAGDLRETKRESIPLI